ncbi:MAG: DUF4184 family protein [Chryseolinea sp.]
MPFTPAHVAIVTPFLRSRRLSAIALIIGSMAPDFEYFFKFKVNSHFSHTMVGLFIFDLPVTYGLAFIFLTIVRNNLISNLPIFLQLKLQEVWTIDIRETLLNRWPIFIASALLGAASHIFWDAFTHNNTIFTSNLSIYKGTYVPYEGVKYPLWYALQHISTGIGLLIVMVYILVQKPKGIIRLNVPKLWYWMFLIIFIGITVWVRFAIEPSAWKEGNVVVTFISGLCIGAVLCGVINFDNPILNPHQQDG